MQVHEVTSRAKRGLTASVARQMVVQSTGILTTILLARYLTPKDFGVFGLVSLVVQFFSYIASTGLGVALIRCKEEPTRDDLDSVFTCELIVATAGGLLLLGTSKFLPRFIHALSPDSIMLICALAFSAWLTVFRLLPSVCLERQLQFSKIALVETVENLVFNAIAMVLAVRHGGPWALVAATLARSIIGAAFVNFLAPVRPRLTLASPRLKSMLAVGFGFQGPSVIFFLKDLAMPGFLAATLGPAQLGYFVWVRDLTSKFSTFSGLFAKIAFPTLARLSAAGGDLARSVRRSTILLGIVYWPLAFTLIATSSFYIHYIFSDKWFPAQPLLIIYTPSLLFQIIGNPWFSLSQAESHWRWPLKVAFRLAVWDIAGGLVLIKLLGLPGCGLAVLISNAIYARLYYEEMRRILPRSYRDALVPWKAKLVLNFVIAAPAFVLILRTVENFTFCLLAAVFTSAALMLSNWGLWLDDRAMLTSILAHFRRDPA